ncbi:MAG: regulatory signaling modulator protein AmpE [Burkholderiaceae bacterium]
MELLALIVGMLLEQVRPLAPDNPVHARVRRFADWSRQFSDSGRPFDAVLGWAIVVLGPLLALAVVARFAASIGPLVEFALHVAVIYLCVGFRQFTTSFSAIQQALERDEFERADRTLDAWLGKGTANADAASQPTGPATDEMRTPVQICRVAIVHALLASHRQVLAPIVCYLLLPGASGPVLYRLAEMLARRWVQARTGAEPDAHATFAAKAYRVIDWIPVRLTAASLAIGGDFEDATYCWRGAIAAGTGADTRAMLIAVGSGALGLRLADPELERRWAGPDRPAFEWSAPEPDVPGLRSAAGLVWRSTVMFVSLFALLSLSSWIGR